MNPRQFFRGKHAELCVAIAEGRRDDAFSMIYSFFRSEDNTDSYSIQLLTMVRELLEGGDADELYQLRVRLRSNGDKVLINLVQFLYAFDANHEMAAAVENLSEKIIAELPKLARSMQLFADEDGLSPVAQMQGLRIREAVSLLEQFLAEHADEEKAYEIGEQKLEMTRILLFNYANIVTADLLGLAQGAAKRGLPDEEHQYLREIVENYDASIDMARSQKKDLDKELLETLNNLAQAYTRLDEIEHEAFNISRLQDIAEILDPTAE